MPKFTMSSKIDQLESANRGLQATCAMYAKQLDDIKLRLKDIAAENESLRMDKIWLKQIIQRLVGSTQGTSTQGRP